MGLGRSSELTLLDDGFAEREPALAQVAAAAVSGLPPAGPELRRRPEPVMLRGHPGVEVTAPLSVTELGFSLHAATRAGAQDACGREALCKYVLRPPLAQERLSLLPDGLVRITLRKPFRDNTYAVDMDPLSLLCRLATTIPPPRLHVVRYSGVLAPAAKLRPLIVPPPRPPDADAAKPANKPPTHRCAYIPWALLAKKMCPPSHQPWPRRERHPTGRFASCAASPKRRPKCSTPRPSSPQAVPPVPWSARTRPLTVYAASNVTENPPLAPPHRPPPRARPELPTPSTRFPPGFRVPDPACFPCATGRAWPSQQPLLCCHRRDGQRKEGETMLETRALAVALAMVCLMTTSSAASPSKPPEDEIWQHFIAWLPSVPPSQNPQPIFDGYRALLMSTGVPAAEADRKLAVVLKAMRTRTDGWRVMFNNIYTSSTTGFSTNPSELLVSAVDGLATGRALDVGMGQGRNSVFLALKGWQVTGFDISDEGLKIARANAARAGVKIDAIQSSIQDFDWGTAKWDLIVITYEPAPLTTRDFVAKLAKSLRPHGLVVIESFASDASVPSRRPVDLDPTGLLHAFSDFHVLHFEDVVAMPEWTRDKTRLARLVAQKRP
jgi:SAM-dependent methyltransferase